MPTGVLRTLASLTSKTFNIWYLSPKYRPWEGGGKSEKVIIGLDTALTQKAGSCFRCAEPSEITAYSVEMAPNYT